MPFGCLVAKKASYLLDSRRRWHDLNLIITRVGDALKGCHGVPWKVMTLNFPRDIVFLSLYPPPAEWELYSGYTPKPATAGGGDIIR